MTDRAIGVGKLGRDHNPPPTPGTITNVHVDVMDGDHILSSFDLTWAGWTAEQVIAQWIRRWKDVGSRYERDGNQLTHWDGDGNRQVLTITDDAHPLQQDALPGTEEAS